MLRICTEDIENSSRDICIDAVGMADNEMPITATALITQSVLFVACT